MNYPLVWVAIFFSLGIWISDLIQIPVLFILPVAIILLFICAVTIKRRSAYLIALAAALFFIGSFLSLAAHTYPANHIKNFTLTKAAEIYLEGTVISEPKISRTYYGEPKAVFIMRPCAIKAQQLECQTCGKTKVTIRGNHAKISYGDTILLKGTLSAPRVATNPGEFDYARYLKRNKIFSVLSAKAQDAVILRKGGGNPIVCAAYKIRNALKGLIVSSFPKDSANFLTAILLGLRQDLDEELNDVFMKTGTVHLLAISGLHVGLIAFLVILILKIFRVPRNITLVVAMTFLVFYAVLTNATPSVVRATVMTVVVLFGWLIGRETSLLNSLGLAAIIILGLDPDALFDVGFELSFLSVASILYITPKIEESLGYDRKFAIPFLGKAGRYLREGFFVSLAAWLGVLPLTVCYFNIITPVCILANLFAVPLSFLITAASVPFIIFGFILPLFGKIFSASISFLCATLFGINGALSKIPFAYIYLPKPPLYVILLYYVFLLVLLERRRLKVRAAKLSVTGLLVFNVFIWQAALSPSEAKLKVTFLDVGHGDSIFVEFPRGENMLIDGGATGDWDAGKSVILPFLRSKGIQAIDAIVLTHSDSDHCGGLASVIDGITVKKVFDNGRESRTAIYRRFKDAMLRNKIDHYALRRSDSIEGSKDVNILCINPPPGWRDDPAVEENDKSVVLRMQYGHKRSLFCGDIGEEAIGDILMSSLPISSDLMIVPHHGKISDSSLALIDEADPSSVVISQGKNTSEISRSEAAASLLSAKGIRVFMTNKDGAITAETDGETMSFKTFK